MMDAVITYVNGADPEWQKQYCQIYGQSVLAKRYRDWGLLPYLLRGIEQCMPFVDNVFLIVAFESQVPDWINQRKVHIVYHRDIIPQEFLPTFNSGTIELFMHRIEGLAEQFVYFNDDFFPVSLMTEQQLIENDKVVIHYARHCFALNKYKKRARMADRLARMAAEMNGYSCSRNWTYIRPQHTCTVMLRDENKHLFETIKDELLRRVSPLRTAENPNQYVYTDYLYYKGRAINRRVSTKHCSMAVFSPERIAKYILNPPASILCINDVQMSEQKQAHMQEILHKAFEQRFACKSRFER